MLYVTTTEDLRKPVSLFQSQEDIIFWEGGQTHCHKPFMQQWTLHHLNVSKYKFQYELLCGQT